MLGNENKVWYDVEGGLKPGDSWWSEIVKTLTSYEIFIVIVSPDAMESEWVIREYEMALNGKKLIIPLFYRKCEIRADIKMIQGISFLPPKTYEAGFNELLRALGIEAVYVNEKSQKEDQKQETLQKIKDDYVNEGLVYRKERRYPQALVAYNHALELDPRDPYIYGRRAEIYLAMKKYDQALEDLGWAFELDPGSATAWAFSKRGKAYSGKKEYRKALEDFNHALELDEHDPYIYGGRAEIYLMMKEYKLALEDMNQAFKLEPRSATAWAYATRGRIYMGMKEYQKACDDFDHAYQMAPKDTLVNKWRNEAYEKLRGSR
jgi:tetratricopeptide (TPR) repeat protein